MVLLEINILKKEKSFTYIKNNKYKAYCIDGIQYLEFIVINDKIE